eukprot:TRINITY_DN1530_c0_g1_i1.p1 TRINITY_DN1530_c0_g1~~TRINITY_DN1530_c0_g1_i1.p1  ORF type:complete len:253 (+),score=45.76 TRINITY_DN1530_c0_g1_i1:80-838(+)
MASLSLNAHSLPSHSVLLKSSFSPPCICKKPQFASHSVLLKSSFSQNNELLKCRRKGATLHLTLAASSSSPVSTDDFDIPELHKEIYEEIEKLLPTISNKTWYPKGADQENSKKKWYVVDATDKILGRLASTIAIHIRGKHLPTFSPSMDMGSYVIVVNAEKVAVSGNKRTQKLYRRHSGRPGGMKVETFDQLQKRIPERIIEHAVRGMLPKGRLGRRLFTHLKVYKGPNHPHEAQKPEPLPILDKRMIVEK